MEMLMPIVFVALFVASIWLYFARSEEILRRWAAEHGFEIISARRAFFGGPFWWRKSENQAVFRVTVRDAAGRTRSGHVRCGGWFLGLFSDAATAEWDG
jgi:hypothetical protein